MKKYRVFAITIFTGILALGGVLGALNNYPAFIRNVVPVGLLDPNIEGIWFSEYSYPTSSGFIDIKGTTEYFKNSNYNFNGEVGVNITIDDGVLAVLYMADGTGEWQVDSKTINIKLNDLQSVRKSVHLNEEAVDENILRLIPEGEDPFSQYSVARGTSEEYRIVSESNDTILVETDDPAGNLFEIEMKKQSRRFQR